MKLWSSRAERKAKAAARAPGQRRARIFIWSAVIALILGVIEFGEPLEALPRAARDALRSSPVSGSIVMVTKDDTSAAALGKWPISRKYDAQLIDQLFAQGARRIVFDEVFGYPSTPDADAALGAAMAKYPGRITVGARVKFDRVTGIYHPLLPISDVRKHAQLATIMGIDEIAGTGMTFPTSQVIGGVRYPSLASVLAERPISKTIWFRPDFSKSMRSIPTTSYVDVITGRVKPGAFSGKDVVIAPVSESLNDIHLIFPFGLVPGSYVVVVGGETLKQGIPIDLGWLPPYALGLICAACLIYVRRKSTRAFALGLSVLAMACVPILLDAWLVRVDLFPGFALIAIAGFRAHRLRAELSRQMSDDVSGLPNFEAFKAGKADPAEAIIVLKIRNFAEISSSVGIDGGATIVRELVARLRVTASALDIHHANDCLVWRSAYGDIAELTDHIDGLGAILTVPANVNGRLIDVSAVFGIDTEADRGVASRLGSATALAEEAAASGMRWKRSDPARHLDADWRMSLLGRMDQAIDEGEIWVAYQPQIDLKRGRVLSAEALVRWTHPQRGPIPPDAFVLAAERGNRIEKLTWFVMDRAIADTAAINRSGRELGISVNLSTKLLGDRELVGRVAAVLERHSLPARLLTIEITESSEIEQPRHGLAVIRALRDHGINVSIDDYGTGHSTLEYLRSVPANEVKIDKQFIATMTSPGADRILVDSTISLAHSLGQRVVAEGVEDLDVLARLRSMGCDAAQGYLIGHPMALTDFLKHLGNEDTVRQVG